MGTRARNTFGLVAGGVGSLLGVLLVVLWLGLWGGGVSYRKDCPTAEGVKKSWSFTWMAPIPYVFRPSEPGCEIHTGTRVALASIGIGKFSEASSATVADQAVAGAGSSVDQDTAYWVKLNGALTDYYRRNKKVADLDGGLASVTTVLKQLDGLEPTPRYAAAHVTLIRTLRQVKADGAAMKDAVQRQDQATYDKLRAGVLPDAKRVQSAMARLDAIHSAH
jgi:hypothetical protein